MNLRQERAMAVPTLAERDSDGRLIGVVIDRLNPQPKADGGDRQKSANSGLPENQAFNKASAIVPEKVVSTGPVRKTDPTPSH
jgi:hypothetical protein